MERLEWGGDQNALVQDSGLCLLQSSTKVSMSSPLPLWDSSGMLVLLCQREQRVNAVLLWSSCASVR